MIQFLSVLVLLGFVGGFIHAVDGLPQRLQVEEVRNAR